MDAGASGPALYRFDRFTVDPVKRSVSRDGAVVALRPTVFDTLIHLLDNPGRVVTKEELFEAVWPGRVVEESNISQTMFLLRNALDDKGLIVTAPGRGYRFTATITREAAPSGSSGGSAPVGVDVATRFGGAPLTGLPMRFMPEMLAATRLRGSAYEGMFRSTRPFAARPGLFIHDHALLRMDPNGMLRLTMKTAGVSVDGWLMPLDNRLFLIGSEMTSGAPVFAIFNGVGALKADIIDGIVLTAILDAGRTVTATPAVFERVGDLTGDVAADDRRFESLATADAVSSRESVPEALRNHLERDVGPAQFAQGGDLLLQVPISRSWSA